MKKLLANSLAFVQRVSSHLEGQHVIYFKANEYMKTVMDKSEMNRSMFLAWFKLNKVPKGPESFI